MKPFPGQIPPITPCLLNVALCEKSSSVWNMVLEYCDNFPVKLSFLQGEKTPFLLSFLTGLVSQLFDNICSHLLDSF